MTYPQYVVSYIAQSLASVVIFYALLAATVKYDITVYGAIGHVRTEGYMLGIVGSVKEAEVLGHFQGVRLVGERQYEFSGVQ